MTSPTGWTLLNGDGDTCWCPTVDSCRTVTIWPRAVSMEGILAITGSTLTYSRIRPRDIKLTGANETSWLWISPTINSRFSIRSLNRASVSPTKRGFRSTPTTREIAGGILSNPFPPAQPMTATGEAKTSQEHLRRCRKAIELARFRATPCALRSQQAENPATDYSWRPTNQANRRDEGRRRSAPPRSVRVEREVRPQPRDAPVETWPRTSAWAPW